MESTKKAAQEVVIDVKVASAGEVSKPSLWTAEITSTHNEAVEYDEYTLYHISVTCGNETWTLLRRYSEFYELNELLQQNEFDVGGQFPEKTYWTSKTDEEVVQARIFQLNEFLRRIALSSFANFTGVLEFLKPVRYESQLKQVLSIQIRSVSSVQANCFDPFKEGDAWWPSLYKEENAEGIPMNDLESQTQATTPPETMDIPETKPNLRARIYQLRQAEISQENGLSMKQKCELDACVAKLRALQS